MGHTQCERPVTKSHGLLGVTLLPHVSDAVILYKALTVQDMKAYGGEEV